MYEDKGEKSISIAGSSRTQATVDTADVFPALRHSVRKLAESVLGPFLLAPIPFERAVYKVHADTVLALPLNTRAKSGVSTYVHQRGRSTGNAKNSRWTFA